MTEAAKNKGKQKQMPRKFVRYKEGAEMYGMGLSKFQEIAKEAHATYKLNQLILVNTEILDECLELYRE